MFVAYFCDCPTDTIIICLQRSILPAAPLPDAVRLDPAQAGDALHLLILLQEATHPWLPAELPGRTEDTSIWPSQVKAGESRGREQNRGDDFHCSVKVKMSPD